MLNSLKTTGNPLGLAYFAGLIRLLHISCWRKNESDGKTNYAFVNKFMDKAIAEFFNEYGLSDLFISIVMEGC